MYNKLHLRGLSNTPNLRVDSSLVFVIRLTGNRFVNPIPLNWHEWFPLLSNRHAGSRFARDIENKALLDNVGWVKNVVDSTRFDWIDTNRTNQLKFVEQGRFMYLHFMDLDFWWTMQGGLKMLLIWLDSIDTNHFPCCWFVMPEVDLRKTQLHADRVEL